MKISKRLLMIIITCMVFPVFAQTFDGNGNLIGLSYQSNTVVPSTGMSVYEPSATAQAGITPGQILFDNSKPRLEKVMTEQYADLIQLLNAQGHTVNISHSGLLNHDLNAINVIVFSAAHADGEYTSAEINALEDFVNNGGGVVILGEADRCHAGGCARANMNLSKISNAIANINIEKNTLEPTDLYFSSMAGHPIFNGVNQLYYRYANSIRVPTPEFLLAGTNDRQHILIASVKNLFVFSDSSFMASTGYWGRADNLLLIENLFNYIISSNIANRVDEELSFEKHINNFAASDRYEPVNLLAGRLYRAQYTVQNNFEHRIYAVNVYDRQYGREIFVCTLYSIEPGQSKSCENNTRSIAGHINVSSVVRARSSIDSSDYINRANGWYNGELNVKGGLQLKHYFNNASADSSSKAVKVDVGDQVDELFSVKNTGSIDLYRIRLYSDSVSPVDSRWQARCFIGNLKAGETRHCKVKTIAGKGLHHEIGRAQALDTPVGFHEKVYAANSSYYFGQSVVDD